MYKAALTEIKDKILAANSYFNRGFSDVYVDAKKGVYQGKDMVFPDDALGDYFYLRLPKAIQFAYNGDYNAVLPIVLVAIVRDADPDKLLTNLFQTLINQCQSVSITSANIVREDIVRTELGSILDDKSMLDALARLDNFTIVSLTFSYGTTVLKKPLSCITNPCKEC